MSITLSTLLFANVIFAANTLHTDGYSVKEGYSLKSVFQNNNTETRECDEGYVQDCVDEDCCPESWIGDGYEDCEDQAYGCDLTCYDNDGGDCAPACPDGEFECWDGTCVGDEADCADAPDCSDSLMIYGSDPTGATGPCYSDGSAYFYFEWEGGCLATGIDYSGGFIDLSAYGFTDMFMFYGFEGGVEETFTITFEGGASATQSVMPDCTGEEDCADLGMVDDCSGDGDCCPESWIGDGFEDCEDQAYGCDLTCYDNDGGDCAGSTDGGTDGGTTTTTGGGDCDTGYVEDCDGSGECWPESWIGDGFADCNDQAYGADLTCYDCDGGDCPGDDPGCTACEDTGQVDCWDGSCADTAADCPEEPDVEEPTNVCASGSSYAGYPAVTATWGEGTADDGGTDGGTTTTTGGGDCEDGYVDDCSGDGDCCPESWIGDGFADCEDQAYGCDLTCYDNDGGDCEDGGTTGGTTTGGGDGDVCADSFTVAGSDGTNPCYDDGSGYYVFAWDGGCLATTIIYSGGELDVSAYGFTAGFTFYGFDPGATEDFVMTFAEGTTAAATVTNDCATCEELGQVTCWDGSCADSEASCPEEGDCGDGYVIDCVDTDCCPESWIGDGYEDCEDQAYGCDLTCYDNDGGDCGGRNEATSLIKKLPLIATETNAMFTPVKRGEVYNVNSVARLGSENDMPSSREIVTSVYFECLEGANAGFTGTWDADPALGEFTVYGWDTSDFVCVTVTNCDGGACSDSVGPVCVFAGSDEQDCTEGGGGCDTAGSGDVNGDASTNVLDIVAIVNFILDGEGFDECQLETGDLNGDGAVNVLDIVAIVNIILDGRMSDATSVKVIKDASGVSLDADGFIGGVQMTLSHDESFSIDLTDKAMVADYRTNGTSTTLIVVAPEDKDIFTSTGNFEIVDIIVANSETEVDVSFTDTTPTEVTLSAAYPNPFNPSTTVKLNVPEASYVSVKVYNVMGQLVQTLAEGQMEANVYTLSWDGSNVPSGMYFVRAETSTNVVSQKLMLVK